MKTKSWLGVQLEVREWLTGATEGELTGNGKISGFQASRTSFGRMFWTWEISNSRTHSPEADEKMGFSYDEVKKRICERMW